MLLIVPEARMKTRAIFVVLLLDMVLSAPQYADFYSSLDAFLAGNPIVASSDTASTSAQPSTAEKKTDAPNKNVNLPSGNHQGSFPTQGPTQAFDLSNLNTWDNLPASLFAAPSPPHQPAPQRSQAQPGAHQENNWNDQSHFDTGPSQRTWDSFDQGIVSGGVDSGNMVGGGTPSGMQEPFLPLADHSPGSTMADNPGQMLDWSSPPVSKDTHKYEDLPTPPPPSDAEGMAKAVLRGQVKRWEWTYSNTLLQGEISSNYKDDSQSTVFCCQRLPYICNVDGVCVIDRKECQEFCSCANNPFTPHCTKDVIPRIKKKMVALEDKILQRVSKELNLLIPPPLVTTQHPLETTTEDMFPIGGSKYDPEVANSPLTSDKIPVTPTSNSKFDAKSTPLSKYDSKVKPTFMGSHLQHPVNKAADPTTPKPEASKSITTLLPASSGMVSKSSLNVSSYIPFAPEAPTVSSVDGRSVQRGTSNLDMSQPSNSSAFQTPSRAAAQRPRPTTTSRTQKSTTAPARNATNVLTANTSVKDTVKSSTISPKTRTTSATATKTTTLSAHNIKESFLHSVYNFDHFSLTQLSEDLQGKRHQSTISNTTEPPSRKTSVSTRSPKASSNLLHHSTTRTSPDPTSSSNNNTSAKALRGFTANRNPVSPTLKSSTTSVPFIKGDIISFTLPRSSAKTSITTTSTASTSVSTASPISSSTSSSTIPPSTSSKTDTSILESKTETNYAFLNNESKISLVTTKKDNPYTFNSTFQNSPSTTQTTQMPFAETSTSNGTSTSVEISKEIPQVSSTISSVKEPENFRATDDSKNKHSSLSPEESGSRTETTEALLEVSTESQSVNSSATPTDATTYQAESILITTTPSHKESELVDPNKEQGLLDWFGSNSSRKDHFSMSSPRPHYETTTTFFGDSDEKEPCGPECEKNGGKCFMGSNFKSYCGFVNGDPCNNFQCINGTCLYTEGLYICDCKEGWTGTFCDKPCDLDCGSHGTCGRVGNMTGCICHQNFTGNRCEEKRKIVLNVREVAVGVNNLKVWEVALIAIMAAVCIAIVFIVLPYVLWRRQWLPIRQLIFYFQEYEDDDDKDYDAFISYKSSPRDERFILQHLYPKLEKELDFRLCLHFRDFSPGEPIANNIINAIERSRRTIMVLSPNYVASEWCRMEYQKAQHEMLRLKHKIIPIVLEDISGMPEMDSNLKTIINTVTYIEWPGEEEPSSSKKVERFWKLLELSMPKKKDALARSLSTCSSDVPLTTVSKTCFDSIVSSLKGDDWLSATSLESSSSSASGTSTDSGKSLKRERGSKDIPVDPGAFFEDRKASQVSSIAGSKGIAKGVGSVEGSSVTKSRRSSDITSDKTHISSQSAVSSRTKQLPFEHSVLAPIAPVQPLKTSFSSPILPLLESTISPHKERSSSEEETNVLSPLIKLTSPAPEETNIPDETAAAPKFSSDDFIIEVREVGNQIKVTSRPPRKYATRELMV